MQALHLLALEPVSEMQADRNAYGFRPKRCAADAIGQCFLVLAKRQSSRWILEGDIEACFDRISHSCLEANIPMDQSVLRKWLAAGYMEAPVNAPMHFPCGHLENAAILSTPINRYWSLTSFGLFQSALRASECQALRDCSKSAYRICSQKSRKANAGTYGEPSTRMVTFWIFERYCAAAVNLAVPLNFGTESCTMHKSLNLDEAIVAQFCRQYRVRRLALFGSQLKGTARAGSDIDLLVDFDPDAVPGLLGIAAMELELSRLLGGRKVDLRTAQDLSRHFREEVLRTAEVQYAQ